MTTIWASGMPGLLFHAYQGGVYEIKTVKTTVSYDGASSTTEYVCKLTDKWGDAPDIFVINTTTIAKGPKPPSYLSS